MDQALELIKGFESCRLAAYQDSVGVWTVGWGATGAKIGPKTVWTQTQADADLIRRLAVIREGLRKTLEHSLTSGQDAALCSFVYNLGLEAFAKSNLCALIRAGDNLVAAKEFLRYDHAGGHELRGLLKRRLREALEFIS